VFQVYDVNRGLDMKTRYLAFTASFALLALTVSPIPAATEAQRIERLEMLADIWGKLYLFHPRIVSANVDWSRALIETIPKIEKAESADELVSVLNESLFKSLDDPFTSAGRMSGKEITKAHAFSSFLFRDDVSGARACIAGAPLEGEAPAGTLQNVGRRLIYGSARAVRLHRMGDRASRLYPEGGGGGEPSGLLHGPAALDGEIERQPH
jgi:hypothetical protein